MFSNFNEVQFKEKIPIVWNYYSQIFPLSKFIKTTLFLKLGLFHVKHTWVAVPSGPTE